MTTDSFVIRRKPTADDYIRRELFQSNQDHDTNEYLNFMNSIDWSSEVFEEEGKYGLKNALGEVVVKPNYEGIQYYPFTEFQTQHNIALKYNGKWGVQSLLTHEWVVEPVFDYVGYPSNFLPVIKDGKWGVYNIREKNYLIPLVCESLSHDSGILFTNGLAIYKVNGKTGVISSRGLFSEAIFDDVEWWEGPVKVLYDGVWGYLDEQAMFTINEDYAYFSADCL
jgi:hypothetical protein